MWKTVNEKHFDPKFGGVDWKKVGEDYKSPKKILIEGRGVIPDKEVKLTRRTLLENKDLQLETAIREILEK